MCGFLDRQSAKGPKLDDPGQLSVDLVQANECVIQRQDGYVVWRGDICGLIYRHTAHGAAPFVCTATTSMIDQDPAHDLRGDTKEVRAILHYDPRHAVCRLM